MVDIKCKIAETERWIYNAGSKQFIIHVQGFNFFLELMVQALRKGKYLWFLE